MTESRRPRQYLVTVTTQLTAPRHPQQLQHLEELRLPLTVMPLQLVIYQHQEGMKVTTRTKTIVIVAIVATIAITNEDSSIDANGNDSLSFGGGFASSLNM